MIQNGHLNGQSFNLYFRMKEERTSVFGNYKSGTK